MKFSRKKIIGPLILAALALIFLYYKFGKTPDMFRNHSTTDMSVEVKVSTDDRKPIINTFKLEEYNSLSSDEKSKLLNKSKGKVEGDIPCVYAEEDKNLYFKFLENKSEIELESTPSIKLSIYPASSKDEKENKVVEGELLKSNGGYNYEVQRYRTQYQKYYLEILDVEVFFKVDGEDYVSIFSICSSNAGKDTKAAENEDLSKPILSNY